MTVVRSCSSGWGSRCLATLACDNCSAASCIRPTTRATVGSTTASARLRARSARVPTDLDSTSCWRPRRWCGKAWNERGAVYLAYPRIERADRLLVADLVCIVALLAGVHGSTWKRHRRAVQRERAVR